MYENKSIWVNRFVQANGRGGWAANHHPEQQPNKIIHEIRRSTTHCYGCICKTAINKCGWLHILPFDIFIWVVRVYTDIRVACVRVGIFEYKLIPFVVAIIAAVDAHMYILCNI